MYLHQLINVFNELENKNDLKNLAILANIMKKICIIVIFIVSFNKYPIIKLLFQKDIFYIFAGIMECI